MVFKMVVINGHDIEKVWSSSKSYSINKSEVMNVNGSVQYFYKSRKVNNWESSLKPKEVRQERS